MNRHGKGCRDTTYFVHLAFGDYFGHDLCLRLFPRWLMDILSDMMFGIGLFVLPHPPLLPPLPRRQIHQSVISPRYAGQVSLSHVSINIWR